MATMTEIAMKANNGDQTRKRTSHPGLIIAANTCELADKKAMLTINSRPLSQVIPIPGMRAARLFPTNNSHVRIGVARSGSSVRLVFSPMMLYEAIMLVISPGSNRYIIENCIPAAVWMASTGDIVPNAGLLRGIFPTPCIDPVNPLPTNKKTMSGSAVKSSGGKIILTRSTGCCLISIHSFCKITRILFITFSLALPNLLYASSNILRAIII
jgi:hypothetical protein